MPATDYFPSKNTIFKFFIFFLSVLSAIYYFSSTEEAEPEQLPADEKHIPLANSLVDALNEPFTAATGMFFTTYLQWQAMLAAGGAIRVQPIEIQTHKKHTTIRALCADGTEEAHLIKNRHPSLRNINSATSDKINLPEDKPHLVLRRSHFDNNRLVKKPKDLSKVKFTFSKQIGGKLCQGHTNNQDTVQILTGSDQPQQPTTPPPNNNGQLNFERELDALYERTGEAAKLRLNAWRQHLHRPSAYTTASTMTPFKNRPHAAGAVVLCENGDEKVIILSSADLITENIKSYNDMIREGASYKMAFRNHLLEGKIIPHHKLPPFKYQQGILGKPCPKDKPNIDNKPAAPQTIAAVSNKLTEIFEQLINQNPNLLSTYTSWLDGLQNPDHTPMLIFHTNGRYYGLCPDGTELVHFIDDEDVKRIGKPHQFFFEIPHSVAKRSHVSKSNRESNGYVFEEKNSYNYPCSDHLTNFFGKPFSEEPASSEDHASTTLRNNGNTGRY